MAKTEDRYTWHFDTIPSRFLSTHYYDEMVSSDITGDGQGGGGTVNLDFPVIDSRSILTAWGISFATDSGGTENYEENIFNIMNSVTISLRVNDSGVAGYSGLDFPPNSWIHYNLAGTDNYVLTVMNPLWLVPIQFPIYTNSTPLQVRVVDTALPIGTFYIFARIMGRFID